MVAKTHTDDPFWKFRDQPQEKVAISACCWPRNPSDIAERLYRRRRTATLLFILLLSFTKQYNFQRCHVFGHKAKPKCSFFFFGTDAALRILLSLPAIQDFVLAVLQSYVQTF